jgi:predicted small integral membrane protein
MLSLLMAKAISLYGLALYMSIAVINNTLDKGTNYYLLKQMLNMHHLKDDPYLGKGLLHRAISSDRFIKYLLTFIVICQGVICILFWFSATEFLMASCSENYFLMAKSIATYTLSAFMGLWFFFWCGGFWFGYWIKTPQIQEVHMKLIIISILEIIFINFN